MLGRISALELKYIVDELQELLESKVDRIMQYGEKDVVVYFHKTGMGKKALRIVVPDVLYLSEEKRESPEKPFQFCLFLRKYLNNTRLRKIEQKGFQRIVEFSFSSKEKNYVLIVELFAKGNIILCDEEHKIINLLQQQNLKERTVRGGVRYSIPAVKYDYFTMEEKAVKEMIEKSAQEQTVKMLATELGMGGVFSEELCMVACIDKKKKPSVGDAKTIMKAVSELRRREKKSVTYTSQGKVIDVVPFPLHLYEGKEYEMKECASFNAALDALISTKEEKAVKEGRDVAKNKELKKICVIIEEQKKTLEQAEKAVEENIRKGELLYTHYSTVKDVLDSLKEARKRYSWKDIKEKVKGHKVVKDINDKENSVTIELP